MPCRVQRDSAPRCRGDRSSNGGRGIDPDPRSGRSRGGHPIDHQGGRCLRLPMLSVNAAVTRHSAVPEFAVPIDDPNEPVVHSVSQHREHYRADLSVSQPIYTGGAISANRKRLDRTSRRSPGRRNSHRPGSDHAARMSYWSAVTAASGVDVAEAQIKRRPATPRRRPRPAPGGHGGQRRRLCRRGPLSRPPRSISSGSATRKRRPWHDCDRCSASAPTRAIEPSTMPGPKMCRPTSTSLDRARARSPWTTDRNSRSPMRTSKARRPGPVGQCELARPMVAATGQWLVARPNQRFLPLGDDRQRFVASQRRGQLAVLRRQPDQGTGGDRARRTTGPAARPWRARAPDSARVATARLELNSALEAVASADASAAAARPGRRLRANATPPASPCLSELLDAQADLSRRRGRAGQIAGHAPGWPTRPSAARWAGDRCLHLRGNDARDHGLGDRADPHLWRVRRRRSGVLRGRSGRDLRISSAPTAPERPRSSACSAVS